MSGKEFKDTRSFMYTIPDHVFLDTELNATDMRVYMIVRSFMDTTGEAYPSNAWIANLINASTRTVSRSIGTLVSKQYLTVVEINGQRFLTTSKPIPVDKLEEGRQSCPPPLDKVVHPPLDKVVYQLDQSSITSNLINDHVEIKKKRTAKEIEVAFTHDEKHMLERLVQMEMRKPLAVKIVDAHSIGTINNIIEAGKANGVKNMGAYINISIKKLERSNLVLGPVSVPVPGSSKP